MCVSTDNLPIFAANDHVRRKDDVLHQTREIFTQLVPHGQFHYEIDNATVVVGQVKAFLNPLPTRGDNTAISSSILLAVSLIGASRTANYPSYTQSIL